MILIKITAIINKYIKYYFYSKSIFIQKYNILAVQTRECRLNTKFVQFCRFGARVGAKPKQFPYTVIIPEFHGASVRA